MTKASILINGTAYPVTDLFATEVAGAHPDLLEKGYAALIAERNALLRLSDERHSYSVPMPNEPMAVNGTLTALEDARLRNLDRVINVHHGVNFLRGRSHADYGFDGVDQVHGNQHTMACGCILHSVHDHNLRGTPDAVLQPHLPRRSCAEHAHLASDHQAHWAKVQLDNTPPPVPGKTAH